MRASHDNNLTIDDVNMKDNLRSCYGIFVI